jgi:hypothetical protein
MASPYETLEKAEETTHVRSKHIGLTMALIGVLIAFCAAMVGSQRNELTRTMIEQTQAHSDYSSASTKFRIVMIELERLRGASSETAWNTAQLPGLKRFLRLYLDYSKERTFAKTWADSYQPEVDAHFGAAESYEKAQLIAEIGIVIASLGVLLSKSSGMDYIDCLRGPLRWHARQYVFGDTQHGCANCRRHSTGRAHLQGITKSASGRERRRSDSGAA